MKDTNGNIFGENISIYRDVVVRNSEIGDYSGFAWNVSLGAAEHNQHAITMRPFPYDKWYDFISEEEERKIIQEGNFDYYSASVVVGNDVWGGAGCQVLRGVNVSDGAIIGAGSIVTHNVGPYEIWAGVPAKKISQRFSDEVIAELLALGWWKWPREVIKKYIKYFQKNVDLALLKELEDQVRTDLR